MMIYSFTRLFVFINLQMSLNDEEVRHMARQILNLKAEVRSLVKPPRVSEASTQTCENLEISLRLKNISDAYTRTQEKLHLQKKRQRFAGARAIGSALSRAVFRLKKGSLEILKSGTSPCSDLISSWISEQLVFCAPDRQSRIQHLTGKFLLLSEIASPWILCEIQRSDSKNSFRSYSQPSNSLDIVSVLRSNFPTSPWQVPGFLVDVLDALRVGKFEAKGQELNSCNQSVTKSGDFNRWRDQYFRKSIESLNFEKENSGEIKHTEFLETSRANRNAQLKQLMIDGFLFYFKSGFSESSSPVRYSPRSPPSALLATHEVVEL